MLLYLWVMLVWFLLMLIGTLSTPRKDHDVYAACIYTLFATCFDFDHIIQGGRVRKRRLLPAGWTRAQAEAYDRKGVRTGSAPYVRSQRILPFFPCRTSCARRPRPCARRHSSRATSMA